MGSHVDLKSEGGSQDRLGFALSSEPVFSARLRALLATGVLALSFGAAAASLASETDADQEGVPTQPGAPTDQVGNGPVEETSLPIEVDPVVVDPDPETPDDEAGNGPSATTPLQEVAPTVLPPAESAPLPEQPAPTAPPVAAPPVAPAPDNGTAPGAGLILDQGASRPIPHLRVNRRDQGRERAAAGEREALAKHQMPAEGELRQAPDAPQAPPTTSAAEPVTHRVSIRRGQRLYVVRPGDSLWSIASTLRAPDASVAEITGDVRRLWRLNRRQIGTGDPDLLLTGVRLRLRR